MNGVRNIHYCGVCTVLHERGFWGRPFVHNMFASCMKLNSLEIVMWWNDTEAFVVTLTVINRGFFKLDSFITLITVNYYSWLPKLIVFLHAALASCFFFFAITAPVCFSQNLLFCTKHNSKLARSTERKTLSLNCTRIIKESGKFCALPQASRCFQKLRVSSITSQKLPGCSMRTSCLISPEAVYERLQYGGGNLYLRAQLHSKRSCWLTSRL
jgi:hypothetical protein